jgi:hypothetical protein
MTTRIEHMRALMEAWKNAPVGPRKCAALKRLNSAELANAAKIDKAARVYLSKPVAAGGRSKSQWTLNWILLFACALSACSMLSTITEMLSE